jgi:hypothetical protein
LPEAEIHARLLEAMGELSERDYQPLRLALKLDQIKLGQRKLGDIHIFKESLARKAFAAAFVAQAALSKKVVPYAPIILYRTLGQTLPKGMEAAALVWALSLFHVMDNPKTAARAGFTGLAPLAGDRLFQAILDNPSGVVYADRNYQESWQAIRLPEHRIELYIAELVGEIEKLATTNPS